MSTGIVYVCDECESDRVLIDATAVWNVAQQKWVLGDTFDFSREYRPHRCLECGDETNLVERPLYLKDFAKLAIEKEEANVRAG